MIFWVLAGLLAGSAAAFIGAPLGAGNRRLELMLTVLIPLFALGLYFLIGNPDLAD